MHVQMNGSSPFSNSSALPSSSLSSSGKEASGAIPPEQLQSDYIMIAQELSPRERKLYDNLIYTENYEEAKGIITIGFLRASGLYQDSEGYPLSKLSLTQDLAHLNLPADKEKKDSLLALKDYLAANPSSMALDTERLGNLLDLKA